MSERAAPAATSAAARDGVGRWPAGDGAVLPHVELGDPAGAPLLVIPGLTDGLGPLRGRTTVRALRAWFRDLDDRRVVVASRRDPLRAGASLERMADDLVTLLSGAVTHRPVDVLATSYGGMLAQALALRHPGTVRRLVLASTVAYVDDELRAVLERWEAALVAGDLRGFVRDTIAMSHTPEPPRRSRLAGPLLGLGARGADLERYRAHTAAVLRFDVRDRLPEITQRALVIGGQEDVLTTPRRMAELARGLPEAELTLLPGAGHAVAEQAKPRLDAAVRAFLVRR